jgi:hypothetical protein
MRLAAPRSPAQHGPAGRGQKSRLQGSRGAAAKTRTRRCGGRSRRLAAMALCKVEQMLAAGT